jgi:hypothetical protein
VEKNPFFPNGIAYHKAVYLNLSYRVNSEIYKNTNGTHNSLEAAYFFGGIDAN